MLLGLSEDEIADRLKATALQLETEAS
jgi:hypothetical protein